MNTAIASAAERAPVAEGRLFCLTMTCGRRAHCCHAQPVPEGLRAVRARFSWAGGPLDCPWFTPITVTP